MHRRQIEEEAELRRIGLSLPIAGLPSILVAVLLLAFGAESSRPAALSVLLLGSVLTLTYVFVFGLPTRRRTSSANEIDHQADHCEGAESDGRCVANDTISESSDPERSECGSESGKERAGE